MKQCKNCLETKELTEFSFSKPKTLRRTCKKCINKRAKEDHIKNPERRKKIMEKYKAKNRELMNFRTRRWQAKNVDRARNNRFKREYNITLEIYNELVTKQNNLCRLCNKPSTKKFNRLVVDHCHKTGKIRGLLCHPCNIALGLFKDNIEVLKNAIDYLEKASNSDELVQLELFPLESDLINK